MIEHVLNYQKLGWHLFPVWWVRADGSCACGSRKCKSVAKHPIPKDGLSVASNDEKLLRAWWTKYPEANIGMHAQKSGLCILDVDLYHDDLSKLEELQVNLGQLPDTVVNRSGSGEGFHFIYKDPGFDVRGVIGGVVVRSKAYIILPPSSHKSGNKYVWEQAPGTLDVAELPNSWKDALRKTAVVGETGVPDDEPEWLTAISDETRLADMIKYLDSKPGEVQGESFPGTSFNVIRTAIRMHAVRDQDAALAAVQVWDKKCVPPWEDRIGRHVWAAYTTAHTPTWGEAYVPDEDRLADIGYSPEIVTAPAIPPTPAQIVQTDALVADLEGACKKLKRSTNPKKIYQGKLLTRVLKHQRLSDKPEEEVQALKDTLRILAEYSPRSASDIAVAEVLIQSVPSIDSDTVIKMISKYRAAVPPKDAAQQGELPPPKDDEELRNQLIPGREDGSIKSSPDNIERILMYSEETKGAIKFNELTKEIEVWSEKFDGMETNIVDIAIMNWLSSKWGVAASREAVDQQLQLVARRDGKYDPVATYLREMSKQWDGVMRLDTWLIDYCGAEDTSYNRRVGAMWMIAACARGISPGCKVDNVLVLEGGQGARKSTTFAVLGGPWFSGTPLVLGNKDSYQIATSKWIIELAELSSLRMGEVEAHKAFLSTATDTFRPPYGKVPENCPRHCIFGGTTNEYEYLQDGTGNRRYWAVRVGQTIDIAALTTDRDQLWAEAAARYLSAEHNPRWAHPECPGERWWFTPDEESDAAEVIARRKIEDPYVTAISAWTTRKSGHGPGLVQGRATFSLIEIGKQALDLDLKEIHKQNRHIIRALRECGFEPVENDTSMWHKAGTVVYTGVNTTVNEGSQDEPKSVPTEN